MQRIDGILFEPVGCFAEFPREPFQELASQLFGRRKQPTKSGSRAYWHLLNLMEEHSASTIEALEVDAVESAIVYEDVKPALTELRSMHIRTLVASSLSSVALRRFLEKSALEEFFDSVHCRDNSGGIKATPLKAALADAGLGPRSTVFLTDTAEGMKVARSLDVNPVLMMNDPDEAKRLALQNPAGGIVSLHELCDLVRVVGAQSVTKRVLSTGQQIERVVP